MSEQNATTARPWLGEVYHAVNSGKEIADYLRAVADAIESVGSLPHTTLDLGFQVSAHPWPRATTSAERAAAVEEMAAALGVTVEPTQMGSSGEWHLQTPFASSSVKPFTKIDAPEPADEVAADAAVILAESVAEVLSGEVTSPFGPCRCDEHHPGRDCDRFAAEYVESTSAMGYGTLLRRVCTPCADETPDVHSRRPLTHAPGGIPVVRAEQVETEQPRQYRDRQGDTWQTAADGRLELVGAGVEPVAYTHERVDRVWGPLVEVTR